MKKYREAILYVTLMAVIFIHATTKLFPEIVNFFKTEMEIKAKTAKTLELEQRLDALKAYELEKLNVVGLAKKIYTPESTGLDTESSFAVILDDIINMAKYNGVKIYSVEYIYNPPEDEFIKGAPDKYNVCQIIFSIISDYSDLESFLKDIYKYPYLVNLDEVRSMPYPKDKKVLLTELKVKLYASKQ